MTRETFFKYTNIAMSLQNHPANVKSDKMTIMGFMNTEEELRNHVISLAECISEEEVKKTIEKLDLI